MHREIWRSIDGFPGYDASNKGRVRSFKNFRGDITREYHILKPRMNPNGYHIVVLYDTRHRPHQIAVHRLIASTFIPVHDDSLVVDHLDGDKTNNNVSNLEWVTGRENSLRAYNSGLYEAAFRKTRRPLLVTNLRTGEEIYFESVNEAARRLGFSPSIISRAANLLCDKVGHYQIEFAENEERLLFNNYNF